MTAEFDLSKQISPRPESSCLFQRPSWPIGSFSCTRWSGQSGLAGLSSLSGLSGLSRWFVCTVRYQATISPGKSPLHGVTMIFRAGRFESLLYALHLLTCDLGMRVPIQSVRLTPNRQHRMRTIRIPELACKGSKSFQHPDDHRIE